MKRFTILCAICAGVILVASSFSNYSTSTFSSTATTEVSQDYKFIGDYIFQEEGEPTITKNTYEVYEATNACGMYYAKINGKYYKMMEGKYIGHNYYVNLNGVRWWTTI